MLVTSDYLALTAAGLRADFFDAYAAATVNKMWPLIASQIDTTLPIANMAWLGRGATMRELKDRPEEQDFAIYNYSLAVKTWKALIKIDRTLLEDDQYGQIQAMVQKLANEPNRHWNKLAYTALALGNTNLCYDGQYFFDNDHSEGLSGVQVNKGSAALSTTSLAAAEQAMMSYVDDKGEPLEIVPDTLVVGPKNRQIAWELTQSSVVVVRPGDGTIGTGASGASNYANYWQGRYKVVVSPYLVGAYDDYWFLLDTEKPVKPVLILNKSNVPITTETDMEDGNAKILDEYQFAVRGRYNFGYGLWQTAWGAFL